MKSYMIDDSPNLIYFRNPERIPEQQVCNRVKEILINAGVKIGSAMMGPSEDVYACEWSGKSFSLIYDIDEGACLYADDPDLRRRLAELFS